MLEYLPYTEMLKKGEGYEKEGLKPFCYAKDIDIKKNKFQRFFKKVLCS